MGHDLMGFWKELVACAGDVDRVLNLAAQRAAELIGEGSVVSVLSADGRTLELAAMFHTDPQLDRVLHESLGGVSVSTGEGLAGMVATNREAVMLSDLGADAMVELSAAPWWRFLEHHPVNSLIIVPMVVNGEVVGTFAVVRTGTAAPYLDDDRLLLEALAEQTALALAAAQAEPPKLGPAEYEAIFRHSLDGVLLTAPDGQILAANPAACEILQRSEAEICRVGRAGLVVESDPRVAQLVELRAVRGRARGEMSLRRGDDEPFVADVSSTLFTTADGAARTVLIFRDVSEQVAVREQLERQRAELEDLVDHDPLTGLLSRRGFTAAAEGLLAIADREGASLLLAFFDLDGLKAINDDLGHFAGDDALRRMGEAITGAVREVDAAARLAGDEFVVLLHAASDEEAHLVIRRIATALDDPASRGPRLTFSVGTAARASGSSETLDELLRVADQRMYQQKVLHRVEAHRRAAQGDRGG
jgi:diguanylate cyclase (GGDEF)-like protein/PAS domain S-box-containing protein